MTVKKNKNVKISKAKGRSMLIWVGKRPLTSVKAYPANTSKVLIVARDPESILKNVDKPGRGNNSKSTPTPEVVHQK